MKVRVITHYSVKDPECNGDYAEVSIRIDGVEVIRYGDSSHDKGAEKADGYVDAINQFFEGQYVIDYMDVADYE